MNRVLSGLGKLFGTAGRAVLTCAGLVIAVGLAVVGPKLVEDFLARSSAPLVYVDNFSDRDVRIELDGAPWRTCARGTSEKTTLPPGSHRLVVFAAGSHEPLDAVDVTVEKGKTYVFNALGAQVYVSKEVVYTSGGAGHMPRDPRVIRDKWYEATENFVLVTPPEFISSTQATGSESKRVLVRLTADEQRSLANADRRAGVEADLREIGRAYEVARGATQAGVVGPTPPQGFDDLSLRRPLDDRDRYAVVWSYTGGFGRPEPDCKLAWERLPWADGKRYVLMGDFITVRLMDTESLARTPPVRGRSVSVALPAALPTTQFGSAPTHQELQNIIRSSEAFQAGVRGFVGDPNRR